MFLVTGPVTMSTSAWRGEATNAVRLFEIVERVIERMNFQLAAVARSGVDLADRKAAAETAPCGAIDASSEFRERRVIRRRRRL